MIKRLFILLICASLSSCHAGFSLSGASIPDYAKTFSVQYFKNQAQLAGPTLAQNFTDVLRNYVASHSRLSLATTGDLQFEGVISGYSIAPVTATSATQGVSATTRLTITVDVTYTDKKDTKKCFNSSFSRYADYPSSQNLATVQDGLITQISNQLVQDIFDKAFNNW